MSHFTHMKTSFQNFEYLEKALNKLNISNYRQENINIKSDTNIQQIDLIIPQSNNYDLKFSWNGEEYELIADLMYWDNPYPVETLITSILDQYAKEVIVGESSKIGFQPIELKQNTDGSHTIKLERWNINSKTKIIA